MITKASEKKLHPRTGAGMIGLGIGAIGVLLSLIFKKNGFAYFFAVIGGIIAMVIHNKLYDVYYAEEIKQNEERKQQKAEEKRLKKEQKEKEKMDKNDKVV